LRVEMSSGVSANPYLQFYTVAKASGVIEFSWVDDAGVRESAAQRLDVIG
ncbi:MAG: thiosulfate oxidation carrier complex protein SoxZ, partial [Burkholderiales bacterium]|nr:thiosulfate oxidation carrier complex protein SoxZ [Burkholderiales bacterium]